MKSVLVTVIASLFIAQPVNAQQLTLSISPPLVEAVIKPGKSILIAYTISNIGDPAILSADIRPFEPRGIYGDLVLKDEFEGPVRFNLENSDIELGEQFFLQTRQGQQLLLKIRVPEGTPEGDYYYTFYVQNDLGKPQEGANATRNQALVGSNLLITVTESGQVDVGGSIGQLSVAPRMQFSLFGNDVNIFESTDVIPVKLILQNTGRNVVKPNGDLFLEGPLGERAKYGIVPQNVLSDSSRLVSATPSADIDPDSLKKIDSASLYLSGFFVGQYTLRADVNFGIGTESQSASTTFIAIPIKLIVAGVIALILGVIIVKKFRQDED